MGLLDGKVVLITGAGGGIGRCHALACARAGARIVVNDLGGARDGTGSDAAMADVVVGEIEALGGEAVANYDSVTDYEGCERMVRAALDRWGQLDVVVNNAGILRDRTFSKMSPDEWRLVLAVHLDGTQNVARAALDALKASGAGRLINTTSYSGMIGNFGQSNYAAAKAGIYGFSRVLALELRRSGVTVNCVAPVAKTRMTDDIAMVQDEWGPEQISPIVVFLASDLASDLTGHVFGVQGQRIHLYAVHTNDGVEKEGSELWTAAEIAERLPEIMAWPTAAAEVEDAGEIDVVTEAFSYFPLGFKPAGAPGWTANVHWQIAGGTDQTLSVADGVCTVRPGLHGSPTCTVKTDRDTVVALLSRELEPAQAFMSGKAAADNMGDLMKMATAFDFDAMAAARAAATKPEVDVVSAVFAHFPAGFKPGAAEGWRAVLQWQVAGGTDQTVVVDGDGCRVEAGLVGSPTCTVKADRDTLVAMFKGELDPTQVFMSGKATADNMGDLMKMSMAFDFRKVAEAFAAAHPELVGGEAPPSAPAEAAEPQALPIGKRYDGGYLQIRREDFQAYARATDDDNPAYFGPDAVAPPMFHVRPFLRVMMKCATDPQLNLDLLRLVHGEHDVRFHKVLRHGDVLQLRATLDDHQEKSSGRVVRFGLYGFVDGELAIEGTTVYFIRGKRKKEASSAPRPTPEAPPAPDWTVDQVVHADQASRYAAASGDDNPIHLDPATAKAAGLPGVILHGLCTMAFAQRDIVNLAAGGDPSRLARLAVRWAKPVFLDQTLQLEVWEGDDGLSFTTKNAEGQAVVTNGRAELRS